MQEEKLWTLYRYFDIHDKGYFNATDIVEVAAREGRNISNEEKTYFRLLKPNLLRENKQGKSAYILVLPL